MRTILTPAQEQFGDQYAGFFILLRRLGNSINVDLCSHNTIKNHKWEVLAEVHASKPVDFKQAAEIITEITDVEYDPEELEEYIKQYNESLEL